MKFFKYILFTVVLTAGVKYILEDKETALISEDQFALSNSPTVNKILLYKKNLPAGGFVKTSEGGWQLNGNISVDPKMTDLLFSVLRSVKVKDEIEEGSQQEIKELLKKEGTIVEYYEKNYLTKAIFLKDIPGKNNYSYALIEGSETPFIVYVPGAKNSITQLLSLPELQWSDRTLFSNLVDDIEEIKVDYYKLPEDSFEINKEAKSMVINGQKIKDIGKITDYLEGYATIKAASISNNEILLDSLKLSKPFCKISLKDRNAARNKSLELYSCENNSDFYYVKADNQEFVYILSAKDVLPILKNKSDLLTSTISEG